MTLLTLSRHRPNSKHLFLLRQSAGADGIVQRVWVSTAPPKVVVGRPQIVFEAVLRGICVTELRNFGGHGDVMNCMPL